MPERATKFQMTIYPDDLRALDVLADVLEAQGVDIRGRDGRRSKAAVMRYALREAAERVREKARQDEIRRNW